MYHSSFAEDGTAYTSMSFEEIYIKLRMSEKDFRNSVDKLVSYNLIAIYIEKSQKNLKPTGKCVFTACYPTKKEIKLEKSKDK